jgi:hypothetical protein
VSQLPLDHVERYALPGHLDGMSVAQPVWGESTPDACADRGASKRNSDL